MALTSQPNPPEDGNSESNSADITRFVQAHFKPGDVIELRVLNVRTPGRAVGQTHFGYFDNSADLCAAAAAVSSIASGAYCTLNPVLPELLSRRTNRLGPASKADPLTSNGDIARRSALLVDLDPVRPSGIPSTEAEHAEAHARAAKVRDWLSERGWPKPTSVDSGNGAHLVYCIDLPADDGGLVKLVLEELSRRFDDERVHIDKSVHNAARLVRLPGTWNRKGDESAERPHRLARLVALQDQQPGTSPCVTDQQLRDILHVSEPAGRIQTQPGFDLRAFVETHELEGEWKEDWPQGELFVLEKCPWNVEHKRTARIGRLTNGGLFAACFHHSCSDKGWAELRGLFGPTGGRKNALESQTRRLLRYVEEAGADLWSTPGGQPFITVPHGDAKGHLPLDGSNAEAWLRQQLYEREQLPGTAAVIRDVIASLQARARFAGGTHEAHVRTALMDDRRFVDLGDTSFRAVSIGSAGWSLITEPPARFFRSSGTKALPEPLRGGKVDLLRKYLNVADDLAFRVIVAWLTWAVAHDGPCPILSFTGEQGSAKTTAAKVLLGLLDPRTAALTGPPKNEQDLIIAASTQAVLAFDNLSGMGAWLADALCRLTGTGALATRALYKGRELELFEARRPIMLTGIGDPSTRADLLDRIVMIPLVPIPLEDRRPEREFWEAFREDSGAILGGMYDLMANALRLRADVPTRGLPRMADFAQWGVAVERAAGWADGSFLKAYAENREQAQTVALEGDPVAGAVLRLLASRNQWEGSATDLLVALNKLMDEMPRGRGWPTAPNHLSNRLTRLAPVLRSFGIEVKRDRQGENGDRVIQIVRTTDDRR